MYQSLSTDYGSAFLGHIRYKAMSQICFKRQQDKGTLIFDETRI